MRRRMFAGPAGTCMLRRKRPRRSDWEVISVAPVAAFSRVRSLATGARPPRTVSMPSLQRQRGFVWVISTWPQSRGAPITATGLPSTPSALRARTKHGAKKVRAAISNAPVSRRVLIE